MHNHLHLHQQDCLNPLTLMPTRQQLQAFLQDQGVNPEKLKSMTAWELVQLTREYYKQANVAGLQPEPCA
jgi:hypothetical protein